MVGVIFDRNPSPPKAVRILPSGSE